MTTNDTDCDKFGDRGQPAGMPAVHAFGSREFDDETRAIAAWRPIPVVRKIETVVASLSQATLDECRRIRLMADARRDFIAATNLQEPRVHDFR